eukprot:15449041-Alexandrium_andersonii.AAC.1
MDIAAAASRLLESILVHLLGTGGRGVSRLPLDRNTVTAALRAVASSFDPGGAVSCAPLCAGV